MKTFIAILIFGGSLPVIAYENIGDHSNRQAYESQKGYAYENNLIITIVVISFGIDEI